MFPLCDFFCSQKDDTLVGIHQKQEIRETGKGSVCTMVFTAVLYCIYMILFDSRE